MKITDNMLSDLLTVHPELLGTDENPGLVRTPDGKCTVASEHAEFFETYQSNKSVRDKIKADAKAIREAAEVVEAARQAQLSAEADALAELTEQYGGIAQAVKALLVGD